MAGPVVAAGMETGDSLSLGVPELATLGRRNCGRSNYRAETAEFSLSLDLTPALISVAFDLLRLLGAFMRVRFFRFSLSGLPEGQPCACACA